MSYRPGPRANRLFRLLDERPLPRARCPHLRDDASHAPRLLTSWEPGVICCPNCAAYSRDRVLAEARPCPVCGEATECLLIFAKREGPITVAVGMCARCAGDEEVSHRDQAVLQQREDDRRAAFARHVTFASPATATPNGS